MKTFFGYALTERLNLNLDLNLKAFTAGAQGGLPVGNSLLREDILFYTEIKSSKSCQKVVAFGKITFFYCF